MATNKNRINAYVGDGEYNAFTAFCDQWQCSQSKGVELMIRYYLMGENNVISNVISNVTEVSTDELRELRERLGKLESNVMNGVGYVTLDEVEKAIAKYPTPLDERVSKIAHTLKGLTDQGYDFIHPSVTASLNAHRKQIEVITDSLTTILERLEALESPQPEPEGITAATLAPIFDEPEITAATEPEPQNLAEPEPGIPVIDPLEEKQPFSDDTPSNDVLLIEEKLERLLSEIEGQSIESTESNTEEGITGKELAVRIGLFRSNGQPGDDTLSKWHKKHLNGESIQVSTKNKSAYQEFLRWEKKGDRWFLK